MTMIRPPLRSWLPMLFWACGLAALAGCHAVDLYTPRLQAPVPPAMMPPSEKARVSLPTYRVEPPDILQIEMLKLVPLPPYRIDIYDVLQIRVLGTILDQPIDGFYLVEGEGIVSLGPAYGTVRVAGMTIEEATEAISRKLQEVLAKPDVSVQLARTAGTQPITGQYLIGPDGTINLRQYGTAARGRQDGHRDPARPAKAPVAVLRLAGGLGRRDRLQQQGVLRDYRRGRAGRQRPPRADHRQRDGAGRPERGQRAVAGVERADLDGAAGAGRVRLRADSAGRLRRDQPRRRRRPRTIRFCPATGCSSPRTT